MTNSIDAKMVSNWRSFYHPLVCSYSIVRLR